MKRVIALPVSAYRITVGAHDFGLFVVDSEWNSCLLLKSAAGAGNIIVMRINAATFPDGFFRALLGEADAPQEMVILSASPDIAAAIKAKDFA